MLTEVRQKTIQIRFTVSTCKRILPAGAAEPQPAAVPRAAPRHRPVLLGRQWPAAPLRDGPEHHRRRRGGERPDGGLPDASVRSARVLLLFATSHVGCRRADKGCWSRLKGYKGAGVPTGACPKVLGAGGPTEAGQDEPTTFVKFRTVDERMSCAQGGAAVDLGEGRVRQHGPAVAAVGEEAIT